MANLVLDYAELKPLTDELRMRLAARASVLRLTSLVPHFGSLGRDPVHPSTYYLAVDGDGGQPLLLHIAPANAPTSSLFPKPLLVGRMPRAGGPEMVINCLPFGPADRGAVEKFAAYTDTRLLPRPLGPRPSMAIESDRPETDFPLALEAFRGLARRGKRIPVVLAGPNAYPGAVWAAIRAGWRQDYSIGATIVPGSDMAQVREAIRQAAACSRFTVAIGRLTGSDGDFGPAFEAAEAVVIAIREIRSALKGGRPFDLELDFTGSPRPTSPADLRSSLEWMKTRGHLVQSVAPEIGPLENPADLAELAAVARAFGATLSLASKTGHNREFLAAVARATLGRMIYRLSPGALPEGAASLPDAIQQAAAHLSL